MKEKISKLVYAIPFVLGAIPEALCSLSGHRLHGLESASYPLFFLGLYIVSKISKSG